MNGQFFFGFEPDQVIPDVGCQAAQNSVHFSTLEVLLLKNSTLAQTKLPIQANSPHQSKSILA